MPELMRDYIYIMDCPSIKLLVNTTNLEADSIVTLPLALFLLGSPISNYQTLKNLPKIFMIISSYVDS
jgi:hypothetical protein